MNRYLRTLKYFNNNTINFDLAIEAHDLLRGAKGGEISGVVLNERTYKNATVKDIRILDEQGAKEMHKPIGNYLTISTEALFINNRKYHQELAEALAQELSYICPTSTDDTLVLIAGLGNQRATPDALGPRITEKMIATRHLVNRVPAKILAGVRPIATIAPGVLGMTGIETAEMLKAIVDLIKPQLLVVCDALAAGDISRIGTTIQISDSGINPGSGLGNNRTAINSETIGIPTIAIGVPTVVNSTVIAHNLLESFLDELADEPHVAKMSKNLPPDIIEQALNHAIDSNNKNLTVTPKEIDDLINNTANVIAQALGLYLHPQMNEDFAEIFI